MTQVTRESVADIWFIRLSQAKTKLDPDPDSWWRIILKIHCGLSAAVYNSVSESTCPAEV